MILALALAILVPLVFWSLQPPLKLSAPTGSQDTAASSQMTLPPASGKKQLTSETTSPRDSDPRKTGSPLAAELNSPSYDAQHDVATLHKMLQQYLRITQRRPGPPIGNDSDIARAFTGHNPMKLIVLPEPHPALSADGRLRDRWNTPYFIHPRGNHAFEIRSAGPDRKLFTADDLVENPSPARTEIRAVPIDGGIVREGEEGEEGEE